MLFALLFLNCVSTLARYIYFNIIKIFSFLFFLSNKLLQIWNFYLDITMSFSSYSIHDHLPLRSRSLYWLLSNPPRLSTTPTAPFKSQFLTSLIKTFKYRVIDTNEFPPIIDTGHICRSVMRYERHVEFYIAVISRVCCCCELFVSLLSLIFVLRSDPMIVAALDKDAINMAFLNHCGWEIDEYRFCYSCFNILKQKKVPKFSSINKVKIILCQDNPPALEALTLVKQMLIAGCHPVMLILKL